MDCNKDEAIRARGIAEIKLSQKDFVGAKKFLLKAKQLFPALEGLYQMLNVLAVHTAAEQKLGGTETDWYGVLQIDSGADDKMIKRQYRKLAKFVHPDKNKFMGAEEAFRLINDAFNILSDQGMRALHDEKTGVRAGVPQSEPVAMETEIPNSQEPSNTPSVPPTRNPHQPFWATDTHSRAAPRMDRYQKHRRRAQRLRMDKLEMAKRKEIATMAELKRQAASKRHMDVQDRRNRKRKERDGDEGHEDRKECPKTRRKYSLGETDGAAGKVGIDESSQDALRTPFEARAAVKAQDVGVGLVREQSPSSTMVDGERVQKEGEKEHEDGGGARNAIADDTIRVGADVRGNLVNRSRRGVSWESSHNFDVYSNGRARNSVQEEELPGPKLRNGMTVIGLCGPQKLVAGVCLFFFFPRSPLGRQKG